jgi:5,10-methenyltetrahydrofolate synthetase
VKENIRRSLLKRRRSLPKEELKRVSFEINTHLINEIQNRDLKKILVYQSIDNEPSIEKTIKLAWRKDLEIYIPKVVSKEQIVINRLRKNSSYSKNKFGIKESNDPDTIELAKIDLAVLPLVGIDKNGFRLGYGGGYFDRFFNQESELSRKPFIIGTGYAFSVLEVSFAEDHDLKCGLNYN